MSDIEAFRFRVRPREVIAVRVSLDNQTQVAEWCDGLCVNDGVLIRTMEGQMLAEPGDFVVRDSGGHYTCPPDVFSDKFELVSDG
jgi:hypothetical protein